MPIELSWARVSGSAFLVSAFPPPATNLDLHCEQSQYGECANEEVTALDTCSHSYGTVGNMPPGYPCAEQESSIYSLNFQTLWVILQPS